MDEKRLVPLLEEALSAERDGYQFYTMAAERAEDPGARETFSRLAAEEGRHFEALQKEYRSLIEGRGWDPSVGFGERWMPERVSGIFSEEFRRRIRGRHLEMSALSIGLLLEKAAQSFYAAQAEQAEDGSVERFFRELAEWESGHYQLLLQQDESLKEAYWSENRFAPLF
jgi:rubrerythrin